MVQKTYVDKKFDGEKLEEIGERGKKKR